MKKSLIVVLLLMCVLPAFGQKRPFTIADLYKVKTVADPQISPNGDRIAFIVTESFLEKGKANSDVYIMNADGSNVRNLT